MVRASRKGGAAGCGLGGMEAGNGAQGVESSQAVAKRVLNSLSLLQIILMLKITPVRMPLLFLG